MEYIVNGNKYTMRYYLADGICASRVTFVKNYRNPLGKKKVERAFGVLHA